MIQIDLLDLEILDPATRGRFYEIASPERKARANSCRKPEDALRCVAAEALVRRAVNQYCGTYPKLTFTATPEGKPCIAELPDFHFNLSHSGKWVVLAWGTAEVGIDVEKIGRGKDPLARRYFAADEQNYVFSCEAPESRPQRITDIWTAKESYLKYRGIGLTLPPESFSVFQLESCRVRIVHISPDWEYRIALCTQDPSHKIKILSGEDFHL